MPASETLWVASRQTLPLLSQPQLGSPGVAAVTTGDALTVLGRQGDFVQLRTASGAIGWIRSALLTAGCHAPPDAHRANLFAKLQAESLAQLIRHYAALVDADGGGTP